MGLVTLDKWGGVIPKIYDPVLIPAGKGQLAKNCRFDHGGVVPLGTDATVNTPTNAGTLETIYLYQSLYWLAWASDVDAVLTPVSNDSFKRVYFTESGVLKVTDHTLFNQGGTAYPMASLLPSPPAPAAAPVATYLDRVSFSLIATVAVVAGAVVVTGVSGFVDLARVASGTNILMHATGIPAIDGNLFSFSNVAVVAGVQSFTLGTLAALNSMPIQSISKANPAVVGSANHGLLTGDQIKVHATGMTQVDGITALVQPIDANSFSLFGVDSTLYTTFVNGTWNLVYRPVSASWATVSISATGGDSISQANPAAVKHAAHGKKTGDTLKFSGMVGMVQLEGEIASITVLDADNFSLDGVDSSTFTAFVSGYYVQASSYSPVQDPTTVQTRGYVQTYVNSYGDEGPPSAVSTLIDVYDGDQVTVTDTNTAPTAGYGIVSKRLYRLNLDATGSEIYQEVPFSPSTGADQPVATGTFSDTTASAALAEVLATTEWDGAPAGVTGLIPTPGAGMACYVGNTICLSVPGFPHAWPVAYQKTTEKSIMGLVSWGTTVVALTTGLPEAITFTDPANSVPEKIGSGLANMSKRSLVDMGQYAAYSSPEGLVAIGPGLNKVLTADLFTRDDWTAYAPASISAYAWEGHYIGFYDTGAKQAGFLFDPKTDNFIDLDFYATAGYRDPATGILYLQVGTHIVSFATVPGTPRTMDSVSRREQFKQTTFSAIMVLAKSYPVSVDIVYPDTGETMAVSVTSSDPQRVKRPKTLVDNCDVRVYGANGVTVVYLASSIGELPL